ncbi:hypothetical protein [Stenotrophomonas pavanii]|uniref:hypothetical protein n=1 Tax=Stenotrophomonas pavanii TaxID=487698 RepID=UPI001311E258
MNYFTLRPCIGTGSKWVLDHVDNFGAALIVSEEVKSRLERAGVTDVIFIRSGRPEVGQGFPLRHQGMGFE